MLVAHSKFGQTSRNYTCYVNVFLKQFCIVVASFFTQTIEKNWNSTTYLISQIAYVFCTHAILFQTLVYRS
jgi:hypothetical protein